jgi:predicted transposase YbfD/YdcC
VQALCATQSPTSRSKTDDPIRHGRQEHRTVEVYDAEKKLGPDWDSLIVSVARVNRLTWHKDTKTGMWFSTEECSYYASQIMLSAHEISDVIRGHWGIENKNHHVRDVTLMEDDSRIRIKPGHFSRLRSMALNILRANGVTNVRQAIYANTLNVMNLLAYRFM